MCSWCYAFVPVWAEIQSQLPEGVIVRRWLGGLAPDTDDPMPVEMRERLQATWRRIESMVPTTRFNFEFWKQCQPRRSTYPSCRAVIAAREQGAENDVSMTHAIQKAYFEQARNPSDDATLIELAASLGLDVDRFRVHLSAPETQAELVREIEVAHAMGVGGFPSLVLQTPAGSRPIPIDYNKADPMLEFLGGIVR